ncbi:MAG: DNA-processing protein DprA, partial [Victivallales bacterium]
MTEHDALIALNMLPGIGALRLESLLARFEKASAVLEASIDELESVNGIGSGLAEKIADWKNIVALEKELDLIEKGGVTVITKLDIEYPAILKEIYDPPICLYVRGVLPDLNNASLAIVGSRRMSSYGRKCACHFAQSAA